MKVILLKDVDSLGQAGEIVQVADGFARNALIPQHNALIATDGNVAQYESRRRLNDAAADREQPGCRVSPTGRPSVGFLERKNDKIP